MNTKDKELAGLLSGIIKDVAMPQLKQLEDIIKKEGFTVLPRPIKRLRQGKPGMLTKIILSDTEIIGELTLGGQVAITYFVRAYSSAIRSDIRNLLRNYISTEIELFEIIMRLAKARHALDNPPVVTSHKG